MVDFIEVKKEKLMEMIFISLILILGVYNIYLASNTPFLGEDEAGYVHTAELFSKGDYRTFSETGRVELFAPFVPLIYSVAFMITGPLTSVAKMITAIFGLLTLLMIYLIGKKIDIMMGIASVAVMMLITVFFHFSMLAYVDVPIAFFSALFIYLAAKTDTKRKAVLLGIILGLAYFTKVSGFFLVMILGLYALYQLFAKKDREKFKLFMISIGASMLVLAPYILRNIIVFKYPYFIVLDILFPVTLYATGWVGPGASGTTPLLSFNYFINTFGWIPLILGIFGIIFILSNMKKEKDSMLLSGLTFSVFLAMFLVLYSLGKTIAESRYLMIVFPQLAIVGGYFLYKLKEKSKYVMILIIGLFILGMYSSSLTALGTDQSNRFPSDYIEALEWVNENSLEDALIFTTYSGSVRNYAHRTGIWTEVEEFDKVMTSDDGKYVHDTLSKYNVSYIVIWSGVVAEDYFIPHANLAGVFTFKFLDTVTKDDTNFKVVYQNQNNIVLEVL